MCLKNEIIMYKYIIKTMGNVDWMAVVPMLLFFMVFVGTALVWWRKEQKEVNRMANLPLEDGSVSVSDV
jgi:cbb3-type cytochrome oxidase subunit 3